MSIDSVEVGQTIEARVASEDFTSLITRLGLHSTAELRGIVKAAVFDVWLDVFALQPED